MLISRGLALGKLAQATVKSPQTLRSVRSHGTANYRCPGAGPDRKVIWLAEGIQGFAWWWILWHLWTEPDHITGEFEYPDARKWTDEELGIPPIE